MVRYMRPRLFIAMMVVIFLIASVLLVVFSNDAASPSHDMADDSIDIGEPIVNDGPVGYVVSTPSDDDAGQLNSNIEDVFGDAEDIVPPSIPQ